MNNPLTDLNLVDVIAIGAVVLSLIGALKARRGLLAGLASAVGTALFCWLLAAAALVWAPAPVQEAVAQSRVVRLVPPPVSALRQAEHLVTTL